MEKYIKPRGLMMEEKLRISGLGYNQVYMEFTEQTMEGVCMYVRVPIVCHNAQPGRQSAMLKIH